VIAAFRSKKCPGTQLVYCEYASMSILFMTDVLNYHSAGGISQGDTGQPDSMLMNMEATGHGSGQFSAGSRSLTGIGNTSALGYVHALHEQTGAGGVFAIRGRAKWSSFTSPITG